MSDTLQERERVNQREIAIQMILDEVHKGCTIDEAVRRITKESHQMDQHQVNRSGVCQIPGCPCRGWSAQEGAGTKEEPMTETTCYPATEGLSDEHQPAARGGGEWRISTVANDVQVSGMKIHATEIYAVDEAAWIAQVLNCERAEQIITEHNQHQALVAERERLRAAIEVAIHNLNAGNDPKFLADYLRLTLDQEGGPQ